MIVPATGAVISKSAGPGRELAIIGHESAALAASAQILAWIEAEAGDFAEGPNFFPVVQGAVGLRGIFDNSQPVFASNGQNSIEIHRMAIKMHRQNRFGPLGDRALDFGRVNAHAA